MNQTACFALTLLSTVAAAAAIAPDAHADLADDRVLLQDGPAFGCGTGSRGFYRVHEDPDGGTTYSTSTEFGVPAGYYLEIGSIEYQIPNFMRWAMHYTNTLNVGIRRRSGTGSTSVFAGVFSNRATYAVDGTTWETTNEYVTPGAQTHVVSLPHGPLMGAGGRLCATAPGAFWTSLGFTSVRVRGRLVPTGSPVIEPEPPITRL